MRTFASILFLLSFFLTFIGCKKDNPDPLPIPISAKIDYIVLEYFGASDPSTDSYVNVTITDFFGNVLVQCPQKVIRSTDLPIAMATEWDTEPVLTDLSATYRIEIRCVTQGKTDSYIIPWVPNQDPLYQETFPYSLNSSNLEATIGKLHISWIY